MAQRYIEQFPVSDQLPRGRRAEWQYILDCLDTDPEKLDRKIDWIIKRKVLRELHRGSTRSRWHDPRVFMIDLQFHDIRQDRGFFYMLERNEPRRPAVPDAEIEKAKTEPPQDTRARMLAATSSSSRARTTSSTTWTGRTSSSATS